MSVLRPYGLIIVLISFSPANAQGQWSQDTPMVLNQTELNKAALPKSSIEREYYDMVTGILNPDMVDTESEDIPLVLAPKIYKERKAVISLRKQLPQYNQAKSLGQSGSLTSAKSKISNFQIFDIDREETGLEPRISHNEFLGPEINRFIAQYEVPEPLETPESVSAVEVRKWTVTHIAKVDKPRSLKKEDFGIGNVVTEKKIAATQPKLKLDQEVFEEPVVDFNEADLDLLAALLINKDGRNCHTVLGLLTDHVTNGTLKDEAQFHMGKCAYSLKLYKLALRHLSPVLKSTSSEFTELAAKILDKNLPDRYHAQVAKLLESSDGSRLAKYFKNSTHFLLAKEAFDSGRYEKAREWARQVSEKSEFYVNSQIINSLALYQSKKKKQAMRNLENLRSQLTQSKKDKNARGLVTITLARFYFQSGDHKQSFKNYMALDKSHPLWVQGMTEQGWAQLSMADYSGAIGNMYSLHSPYFQSVYMPDTYAIRTIGYLNICQYGDAYRTLSNMEKKHRNWLENIQKYSKKNKRRKSYYNTVAKYLRGGSQRVVDGLPHQVIREMARKKNFLNTQKDINSSIDEISNHSVVVRKINKDKSNTKWRLKKSKERRVAFKANIKRSKKNSELLKKLPEWKAGVRREARISLGHMFRIQLLEKSKKSYSKVARQLRKSLTKDKTRLVSQAGKQLKSNLRKMNKRLALLIENNEFLRYEIYAGSGLNIRYQVSGGKTAKAGRIPASVRPNKTLNWDFEGEYWEDEIGSYRSSLRNNCPKSGARKQANN